MKRACKACGDGQGLAVPFCPLSYVQTIKVMLVPGCSLGRNECLLMTGEQHPPLQAQPYLSLQNLSLLHSHLRELPLQHVLLLQVQRLLQEQHVGALLHLSHSELSQVLLMLPLVPVLALSQWEGLGRHTHFHMVDRQVDFLVLAQDILVESEVADEGVVEVVAEGQQVSGVELILIISKLIPQDGNGLGDGAAYGQRVQAWSEAVDSCIDGLINIGSEPRHSDWSEPMGSEPPSYFILPLISFQKLQDVLYFPSDLGYLEAQS